MNTLAPQLKSWLDLAKIPVSRISSNHWKVSLQHKHLIYPVDITVSNGWVTYGAPLLSRLHGAKKQQFYEYVLQLNSQINGAQIGSESDRLVLVRSAFIQDVSKHNIERDLAMFNMTHEYVYEQLVSIADKFGLRIID